MVHISHSDAFLPVDSHLSMRCWRTGPCGWRSRPLTYQAGLPGLVAPSGPGQSGRPVRLRRCRWIRLA